MSQSDLNNVWYLKSDPSLRIVCRESLFMTIDTYTLDVLILNNQRNKQ